MDINAPFLILNQALEANRPTILLVPNGGNVDAYVLDYREDYLVIEVMGVPFLARPWRDGDTKRPLDGIESDAFSAWTVYAVEGLVER